MLIPLLASLSLLLDEGPKTKVMLQALSQGAVPEYQEQTTTFQYEGISYAVLRRGITDFSQLPVACIGASPLDREIILLDPKNSPNLDAKYRAFVKKNDFSFDALIDFIGNEVFDRKRSTSKAVDKWLNGRRVVTLDACIKSRTGVCRHVALATAYFLDRLSREGKIPTGKSYYIRDVILTEQGYSGHAWNVFVNENKGEAWHLDVLSKIAIIENS